MKPLSTLRGVALITVTTLGTLAAQAQSLYAYPLPGQLPYCSVIDMNDAGQIIGEQWAFLGAAQESFISDPNGGPVHSLSQPDDDFSYPLDINNAGVVVGSYVDLQGNAHDYITDANGTNRRDLQPPPDTFFFSAWAINDQGQILGSDVVLSAVMIVEADGQTWHEVDVPAGASRPWPVAFNENGQVLGLDQRGTVSGLFPWVTGPAGVAASWLGGPNRYQTMTAYDINDAGQVAGNLTLSNGEEASFYTDPGPSSGHLLRPSADMNFSRVEGINDQGVIHGYINGRGHLIKPDRKSPVDVNDLITNLGVADYIYSIPAMNRKGQMAASGQHGCYIICNHPNCNPD